MSFTQNDHNQLQKLMEESPKNRELLQKLLEEQQYTISKISHEIRNPLTLVYSTLQLIESQHPETLSFKYWEGMRSDIEFMITLLQELSTYNNGETLKQKTLSSHDLISRICLSFAASCVDSDLQFSSDIDEDLPDITGDSVKLQEVLLNLLKNARDAVAPNGTIRLNAFAENGSLMIKISDNGCGIPKDQLEEIFQPFVTHKSGGTGLGLAIAKRTILAHDGSITVESKPREGTCFTISLPL